MKKIIYAILSILPSHTVNAMWGIPEEQHNYTIEEIKEHIKNNTLTERMIQKMFRSDLEKVKLLCEEGKVLERKLPFLPLLEVVRADTINAPAIIDYLVLHQKVDINASTSSLERPEDWKGSIDNETALFVATSLDMHCIEDLLKYPDLEKSLKTPAICNGKIGPTPLELAKIFHNDPENKNMRRGKLYGWFIDYMEKHGIKP